MTSKRQISGLKWARRLHSRPMGIPVGRPRGVKRLGIKYENAVAAALPQAERGVWFEFEDRNGRGCCQVDFLLMRVIIECKHTWSLAAHEEIEGLYRPVVEMATGVKWAGVVVARNVTRETKRYAEVEQVLRLPELVEGRSVVHWIGVGPLLAASPSRPPSPTFASLGF